MLPTMIAGGFLYGIAGIMLGVTFGSVTLAVCELGYTRSRIFSGGFSDFFRPHRVQPAGVGAAGLWEMMVMPRTMTLVEFFIYGFAVLLAHAVIVLALNLLFERERSMMAAARVRQLFFKTRQHA
jgi:hypothetical protein